jgi:hypothetical protein
VNNVKKAGSGEILEKCGCKNEKLPVDMLLRALGMTLASIALIACGI